MKKFCPIWSHWLKHMGREKIGKFKTFFLFYEKAREHDIFSAVTLSRTAPSGRTLGRMECQGVFTLSCSGSVLASSYKCSGFESSACPCHRERDKKNFFKVTGILTFNRMTDILMVTLRRMTSH